MSKNMCPGRRNFLKMTAAGAAGIALTAGGVHKVFAASPRTAAGTAPLNIWPGRVVINFNKTACPTAIGSAPSAAQITIIKTMVDDSIKLLTRQTDIGLAWKSIFPSPPSTNALTLTSKIAIKIPIGCNNSLSAPHWSSVRAIIDGLKLMDFGGTKFPATNITIYEAACSNNFETAGYTSGTTGNFPDINPFVYGSFGTNYTDGAENNANPGVKQQYSTVLHNAQFLINVFSPRGHTDAELFTLGFKNHYGTYPTVYHGVPAISQFLRNICCTGPVYNKTVLLVCSGIYGQYEGSGPGGSPQNYGRYSQWMDTSSANLNPTTIIMSTDPISAEMQTIKMMRIQGQGQYTTAAMPMFLKASGGVVVTGTNWPPDPALPNTMDNIGVIDENRMTIWRIINGTLAVKERQSLQARNISSFVTASQIKGHSTFIEFGLPESHVGNSASIEIYDLKGKLVNRFSQKVSGVLNHLSWNETDASGSHVGMGAYIVRLISGGVDVSSKFSIAR